ncbi:MAG: CSLREA domain-containing protein, partial [Acidobacteriota bacterium]
MTHPPRLSAAAALAFAGLVAFAAAAPAADIIVNTTSDSIIDNDGRCTLREAVAAANADAALHGCTAGSGADTILLPSSEIVMTAAGSGENGNLTGDYDISDDLTIRPASPGDITFIDANGLDRIFEVQDGANLALERLQLRGGDVVGFGGAIVTFETTSVLTLDSTVVADNTSTLFGGGIAAAGPTELIDSLVFDNSSAFGGGVYLFNNNKLVLLRSEVSDNAVSSDGGGIFGAGVVLVESTLSDNTAGRDGGGLFLQENDGPSVSTMLNSTVAFNEAERHGGGFYSDFSGTLQLFNVTVAFNAADSDGDDAGDGGGIFVESGTVLPRHSIFGGNADGSTGGVSAPDCSGPIES